MQTLGGLSGVALLIIPLCFYALAIWVVWKVYEILARMNDNLSGIRDTLARRDREPR
jgi:hypothetical protein